jgi:hypothetical protein
MGQFQGRPKRGREKTIISSCLPACLPALFSLSVSVSGDPSLSVVLCLACSGGGGEDFRHEFYIYILLSSLAKKSSSPPNTHSFRYASLHATSLHNTQFILFYFVSSNSETVRGFFCEFIFFKLGVFGPQRLTPAAQPSSSSRSSFFYRLPLFG